ncbi:MAG: hypothetical protein QOE92_1036 [Chloroflexota bacterium]|jgi:hypothetical protein|nr:hypothetical protein [Chloroflexota bacterium]
MVKLLVEALLAIFLHPVAFVLAAVNIFKREDLTGTSRIIWLLVCLFWGIGPILYVMVGGGRLW